MPTESILVRLARGDRLLLDGLDLPPSFSGQLVKAQRRHRAKSPGGLRAGARDHDRTMTGGGQK